MEYVRYPLLWGYAIGRLKPSGALRSTAYIARAGRNRPQGESCANAGRQTAGLFFDRGLIRTAGWTESFIRTTLAAGPMPPQKSYEKKGKQQP